MEQVFVLHVLVPGYTMLLGNIGHHVLNVEAMESAGLAEVIKNALGVVVQANCNNSH